MTTKPIIIIGAGQAGFGAASYLQRQGLSFIVLEKDRFDAEKGYGRAKSTIINLKDKKLVSDNGPEFIGSGFGYTRMLDFINKAGIKLQVSHNTAWLAPAGQLEKGFKISGRTFPYDILKAAIRHGDFFESNPLVLFYGLLKVFIKARGFVNSYKKQQWQKLIEMDQFSFGDFLEKQLSSGFSKKIADTVVKGTWGYSAFDVSAVSMLLYSLGLGKVYYLEEGIGMLQAELAKKLEVRFDSEVTEILPAETGFALKLKSGANLDASGIIFTAPADKETVYGLGKPLTEYEAELIGSTVWLPRGNIVVELKNSPIIEDLITRNIDFLQLSANDSIQAFTLIGNDEGRQFLSIVIKQQMLAKLMNGNFDAEEFKNELEKVIGSFTDFKILDTNYFAKGLPLTPPGTIKRLENYYSAFQTDSHNKFIFAGDALSYAAASQGGAFESGIKAAKLLVRKLAE